MRRNVIAEELHHADAPCFPICKRRLNERMSWMTALQRVRGNGGICARTIQVFKTERLVDLAFKPAIRTMR
jgi:hypothetical protein